MTEGTEFTPPIERFTLRGVHGYKDITIRFAGPATVVVAENGTGKTTVLSALNAFLTRRFHRLAALSFTRLECKFTGLDEPVVLERSALGSSTEAATEMLRSLADSSSVTEEELLDFVQGEFASGDPRVRRHRIFQQVYQNNPGGPEDAIRLLEGLRAQFSNTLSETSKALVAQVRDLMKGLDIIYLPTYRRVERPLLRSRRQNRDGRVVGGYYGPARHRYENEYHYEGIAFGLGDIEARLAELSEEIERSSNMGYRNLSARILNDMLTQGTLAGRSTEGSTDLPDIRTLSLFLGRVGNVDTNLKSLFDNIATLYSSNAINSDEHEFLRYFLSRLNTVILQTKSTEQKIEQFVNVCNSYLTMSSDEKKLAFDPGTLKVVVQNSWANCVVPLDSLSSGEKQIVSLMAKLYLYEGRKLVLIDEPEISLSLDWQRKVLPDVLKSGSVVQLLAITHSPFVFENDLDTCAAGLEVSKTIGGESVPA